MEDVSRILVVSRMTTYCKKAVHYGISLSKTYGASLYIIHVVHNPFGLEGWNLPPLPPDVTDNSILLKKSRDDIDAAINDERARGMEIKVLIREGEPNEVILRVVEEENIDLIIMLAHEEGQMEHFLFGRSNEEIIRKMPCSIFLVKMEPAIFGVEY
jgi:nucleotide-binding universal stress UspA family protein